MCTICLTSGQSMPMPNATVAMTILSSLSLVNALIIPSFWCWSMTLVNTSTSLNLARFGACVGLVLLSPSSALKKRKMSAHSPNDFPYIIILGIFVLSAFSLSTTGLKVVATASNLLTENIMFFLQGEIAKTYGSCIPIVQVTEYRRVFVAVAVRAMMFKPSGSMLHTFPMWSSTARKVCPLQKNRHEVGHADLDLHALQHSSCLPFLNTVGLINNKCLKTSIVNVTSENLPPSGAGDEQFWCEEHQAISSPVHSSLHVFVSTLSCNISSRETP